MIVSKRKLSCREEDEQFDIVARTIGLGIEERSSSVWSSGSIVQTQYPQHRGYKMKIPRMLVHDIRKLYCPMLMNIFNSADFTQMFAFIDTYFVRNVQYRTSKYNRTDSAKEYSLNINGMFELVKYWYSIFRMSPDMVMKFYDATFDRSTGILVCKVKKDCTHIYDFRKNSSYYAPYLFIDKKYGSEVLYANDKAKCDYIVGRRDRVECSATNAVSPEKFEVMQSIVDSVDGVVAQLPLRKEPLEVEADGTFTIYTDQNKRITRIEVYFSF